MSDQTPPTDIRAHVREHYGKIAETFKPDASDGCGCGTADSSCCAPDSNFVRVYETTDVFTLPSEVTGLSLGCGDPITIAELQEGQTVLDLGSGGGIDCFLASSRVGLTGHVIGVDMTASMLEKARANKIKLGAENVEFRLGEIEHLPVADASVDVIISNCVINLSPDKPQVLREAYRVLKPGGKLAVSDVVTDGPLSEQVKASLSAWAGCVAGALERGEYLAILEAVGFTDIQLTPVYFSEQMVDQAVEEMNPELRALAAEDKNLYKTVFSARITARKPQA